MLLDLGFRQRVGVAGQSVNYEPARVVLYCCFFEDESK